MKLPRPTPLLIERADGRCYRIDPPTRAQVRACLALDPVGEETLAQMDTRIGRQLKILVGTSGIEVDPETGEPIQNSEFKIQNSELSRLPLATLTGEEERELLQAIVAMHHGQDPAGAVALQRLLKKKALSLAASGSMPSTPTP